MNKKTITKDEKNVRNLEDKPRFFAKGKPDWIYILLTFLIALIGMITLLSASAPKSLSMYGNSYTFIKQQLVATGVGVFVAVIISLIDYRIFRSKYFRWLCLIALIGIPFLVKAIGIELNYAKRWIKILGFTIQPSELMKILVMFYLASYFAEFATKKQVVFSKTTEFSTILFSKIKYLIETVIFPLGIIFVPALLVYIFQNHMSAALVLLLIAVGITYVGTRNVIGFWFTVIFGGITGGLVFWKKLFGSGFRNERIETFLNPWANASAEGWQITQSLYAIGSGGLLGLGVGQSRQKKLYLPEAQNDFIFAIFIEEMGFIFGLILLLLFFFFIAKMYYTADDTKDLFGKLLVVGATIFFAVQVCINIAVVIGLVPVTGMSLPFFSAGGTSVIVCYIVVGIVISVTRVNNYLKSLNKKQVK